MLYSQIQAKRYHFKQIEVSSPRFDKKQVYTSPLSHPVKVWSQSISIFSFGEEKNQLWNLAGLFHQRCPDCVEKHRKLKLFDMWVRFNHSSCQAVSRLSELRIRCLYVILCWQRWKRPLRAFFLVPTPQLQDSGIIETKNPFFLSLFRVVAGYYLGLQNCIKICECMQL